MYRYFEEKMDAHHSWGFVEDMVAWWFVCSTLDCVVRVWAVPEVTVPLPSGCINDTGKLLGQYNKMQGGDLSFD